ncbi:MAG: hypothetical protein M1818_001037 [Claussenomyces sp. TS43310]|nr:MAG: hypothetical protein M1818_001037 [Claussenomyces sp. TS43310]
MNPSPLPPETLATFLLQDLIRPDPIHTIAAQRYRQHLLQLWQIPQGSSVLEIGPGQGDFTVALADAVGRNGHVVAVDPASLDDALKHSPTLLIAEYGMVTSLKEAFPHVIAALAVNALESYRDDSSKRNIRTRLTPKQIKSAAEGVGWRAVSEESITPESQLRDGYREVQMARHRMFNDDIQTSSGDQKVKSMLLGMQDALESAVARLDGGVKTIRNMDIWVARFEK